MSAIPADAPQPRLCHIIKWPDFDGYGFHLHAEKYKTGQFIGKVDDGSPAEAAGLRKGDRIVEVNGINIAQENHKQVVGRIKMINDETKLLVVDEETDAWYREKNIVIKGTMESILYKKTPSRSSSSDIDEAESDDDANEKSQIRRQPSSSPATSGKLSMNNNEGNSGRSSPQTPYKDDSDHRSLSKASSHEANESPVPGSRGSIGGVSSSGSTKSANDTTVPSPSPTPPLRNVNNNNGTSSPSNGSSNGHHLRPTSLPVSPSPPPNTTSGSSNGLNLNMTVQEMRAKLALRKKYDPKKDSMDLKKKHEIIQGM